MTVIALHCYDADRTEPLLRMLISLYKIHYLYAALRLSMLRHLLFSKVVQFQLSLYPHNILHIYGGCSQFEQLIV